MNAIIRATESIVMEGTLTAIVMSCKVIVSYINFEVCHNVLGVIAFTKCFEEFVKDNIRNDHLENLENNEAIDNVVKKCHNKAFKKTEL